jgi:Cys-tRNA synthase (O-phospho-L-seryl-tRNA:Cys-tRNA synthase)
MAAIETLRERVERLEKEVADNRVLRRRVEELTEQLAQLLVAVEDHDDARVEELLAALRQSA